MALYIHSREKRLTAKTVAFLYQWTHVPSKKWYIGSRTAAGCSPNDGYICSSKTVEPMILENQSEWVRDILCIGEPTYIINLETQYLIEVDAKNNSMSYNKHNGDGKFTSAGKKASESTKKLMSQNRAGVAKQTSHKEAIAKGVKRYLKANPRLGTNAPGFKGFYVSPIGEQFATSKEAALVYKCDPRTIGNWVKNNNYGWNFSPKEVI